MIALISHSDDKPTTAQSRRRADRFAGAVTVVWIGVFVGLSGCRTAPLPEQGSAAEHLYAQRCGSCHKPYAPSSMTAAMWATQVDAMQPRIAQAGLPPLSVGESRAITDYLERNAGTQ